MLSVWHRLKSRLALGSLGLWLRTVGKLIINSSVGLSVKLLQVSCY